MRLAYARRAFDSRHGGFFRFTSVLERTRPLRFAFFSVVSCRKRKSKRTEIIFDVSMLSSAFPRLYGGWWWWWWCCICIFTVERYDSRDFIILVPLLDDWRSRQHQRLVHISTSDVFAVQLTFCWFAIGTLKWSERILRELLWWASWRSSRCCWSGRIAVRSLVKFAIWKVTRRQVTSIWRLTTETQPSSCMKTSTTSPVVQSKQNVEVMCRSHRTCSQSSMQS